MRVFFYKMTNDAGAVPCVQDGILSLAICKPMIRTSAEEDDLIFGFAANSLHKDNRVIYIARVTEVVQDGQYYERACHVHRLDCIYRRRQSVFVRRADALFHDRPGDLTHDLGPPPAYRRAAVLLSTDFRYFGAAGTADYNGRYPLVGRVIEGLKQGHRLHHSPALLEQLLHLKKEIWVMYRKPVIGHPANAPARGQVRGRFLGVTDEDASRSDDLKSHGYGLVSTPILLIGASRSAAPRCRGRGIPRRRSTSGGSSRCRGHADRRHAPD